MSRDDRGRRPVRSRPPAERLAALFAALVVALVAILARLLVLQVRDASALTSLAVSQRIRDLTLPAPRGTIFDRNQRELAMSLPAKDVYADPQLVTDPVGEAKTVAAALNLKEAVVEPLLADRMDAQGQGIHFVYVERGVGLTDANALQAKHLPGIGFLSDTRRYYPAGALAPQVLGFVGVDGKGLDGLEYEYQDLLAGTPGHEVVQEDPSGTLIPQAGTTSTPPVPGDDLVLTIDRDIQYRVQQSLAAAVKRNGAAGGTVVVMDAHSGDILAMATYPWFDPNRFSEASQAVIRNRAVTDVYEPGSVNKVITAAAALQEHVVGVNQRFTIPDSMMLYGSRFRDAEIHPVEQMTLADILAYSSNIGAIKVAQLIGKDRFAPYLQRFGFGRVTGVGFPGEASGILLPVQQWSGTTLPTVSFGQGIAVTPLQMAAVYATIANGGVWVQPRLVRGTIGPSGRFQASPPSDTRRVISSNTSRILTDMLAYAVRVGTGQEAQIPGYWVAGKTGTARIPKPNGTGYLRKYMASFIGFTPASNPRVVVAAVIDEPSTIYGGIAAAPLFKDVARFALARLRVAPAAKPPTPPHAVPAG